MNKYLKLAILTSLMLNSPMAMEQRQDLVRFGNNQIVKLEENQLIAACAELGLNQKARQQTRSLTLEEDGGQNKYLSLLQLMQGCYLPNLKILKMYGGNQVYGIDGFVNKLAQAINVSNIKLKELRFKGHVINDEGMKALTQIDLSEIEVLAFCNCKINFNGVIYLADAIRGGSTPALQWLDMAESDIPSEGVSAIVDAVIAAREQGKLTKLELFCFNEEDRLKFGDEPQQ